MCILSIAILTILAILLCYVFRSSYSTYKQFKHISSLDGFLPNPSILIGHLWIMFATFFEQGLRGMEIQSVSAKLARERPYNDLGYMALWMGNIFVGFPIIIVTRTEIAREILSKKKYVRKSFLYYIFQDLLGNGLVTSNERIWTSRRKIFNPAFHSYELKHYVPIMTSRATKLIEKISSYKSVSNAICIHNMTQLLSEIVLAILLETIFDGQDGDIDPKFHTYSGKVDELMCERISSPWKLFLPRIYSLTEEGMEFAQCKFKVYSESEKCLKKRMELVKKNETINHGIFDNLIKEHLYQPEILTLQDMVDEVVTFISAGIDTTNWAMTFVLFMLGHHPEEQELAYQEIKQLTNIDRDIDLKDINIDIEIVSRMKYLECIIKETLRMFPVIHNFTRHIADDLNFEIDGNTTIIPGDTQYSILCEIFHKNPRYWTNPDVFDPSRFLNVRDDTFDSYSFIPFSAGPRNCIGKPYAMLEMEIILAYIVSAYKIRSLIPLDEIRMNCRGIVQRTIDSLSFILEPRI